jgi:hypothetical protein
MKGEKEMSAGIILMLAAVLFPLAVRVTVTVFDKIGNERPTHVASQGVVPGQRIENHLIT